MDRGDLDDAADRVMLHYADLYGDDYIEDKTLEIEADDDFNLEDVEREFENAASADEEKQEEAQPRLPLSFEDADYGTAASYDMEDIPPDVMADPIALLGWLDSHPPPKKHWRGGFFTFRSAARYPHRGDSTSGRNACPAYLSRRGCDNAQRTHPHRG